MPLLREVSAEPPCPGMMPPVKQRCCQTSAWVTVGRETVGPGAGGAAARGAPPPRVPADCAGSETGSDTGGRCVAGKDGGDGGRGGGAPRRGSKKRRGSRPAPPIGRPGRAGADQRQGT